VGKDQVGIILILLYIIFPFGVLTCGRNPAHFAIIPEFLMHRIIARAKAKQMYILAISPYQTPKTYTLKLDPPYLLLQHCRRKNALVKLNKAHD
jgi:hypothetical protein